MPSFISIDKDWIEGIEKYLTLGVRVLASGNIPIATAITATDVLFKAWKNHNKNRMLEEKKLIESEMGLSNPIIPIEERKKIDEETIQEIFEKLPEKKEKLKKERKRKIRSKKLSIEEEIKRKLRSTLKTMNGL